MRNRRFDKGKIKTYKAPIPVISVGNLSVGGTGKTPFVIKLAEYIISQQKVPGIIGRGYGRRSKKDILVSDGIQINYNTDECGDEMVLIAEKTGAPVFAGEKKWRSALKLCELCELDVLIIDDGFQHRYIDRDLDILLIDSETKEKPFLLPKGRLRESFENHRRADIIALKEGTESFGLDSNKLVRYKYEPKSIINVINISKASSYAVISSIAKPKSFHKLVNFLKINYEFSLIFKDHHKYIEKDILKILARLKEEKCNTILTTEKDWVKLKKFEYLFLSEKVNVQILPIETIITENENLLKNEINKLIC